MRERGQLQIAVGFATSAGRRAENQDFGGVDLGSAQEQALQGIVAALADGAGGAGGRAAAELAVRAFLEGYRAQSELAGVGPAAMTALNAYNRWLHGQAQAATDFRGAATTFTAAVLRGRAATVLHVGDSRVWRLRGETLALLTDDHVALQPDGSPRLLRAVGLDPALRLDVSSHRRQRVTFRRKSVSQLVRLTIAAISRWRTACSAAARSRASAATRAASSAVTSLAIMSTPAGSPNASR